MPLLPGLTTAPKGSAIPQIPSPQHHVAAVAPPAHDAHPKSTSEKPLTAWGKSAQEPVRAPTLKEIQELEEAERKSREDRVGFFLPIG